MAAVPGSIFPRNGVIYANAAPGAIPSVSSSCDVLWYANRCNPRFDPASMNAIISEILNVVNSTRTYNCNVKNNLLLSIQSIAGDVLNDTFGSGIGFMVKTGTTSYALRTLLGTSGEISVSNGNGGTNPQIGLPNSLVFTGKTVSNGTFNGASILNATIQASSLASVTIANHTFTDTVNIRIGTYGTLQDLWNIGWSTQNRMWSWALGSNGSILLVKRDPSTDVAVEDVFVINHTTMAARFWANLLVQGGITAVLQSTFQSNVNILGSLSKGSGTFKIDHPLYPANKTLLHGFVEAPRYDLIYRGVAKLKNGVATVEIDGASGMSPGTFDAIATNVEITLQNKTGFARVKPGWVLHGAFEIICEDEESDDEIFWVVYAERDDPFVKSNLDPNTDVNGRLIVEVEKV